MGRNIFITLATLFIANYVSAQSISGKVVDENQEPVPYASCVLMNASDSTFVAGAASNLDGVFNLNVPEASYIIQISYIGYKTKEITMSYFICPICSQPLQIKGKSYIKNRCPLQISVTVHPSALR